MSKQRCSVDGCKQPVKARGLCLKHYQRKKRGNWGGALDGNEADWAADVLERKVASGEIVVRFACPLCGLGHSRADHDSPEVQAEIRAYCERMRDRARARARGEAVCDRCGGSHDVRDCPHVIDRNGNESRQEPRYVRAPGAKRGSIGTRRERPAWERAELVA